MSRPNNNHKKTSRTHWSALPEKGNILALKLMLLVIKLIGRRIAYYLVYPVMLYFYCFSKKARTASKQYFLNLTTYAMCKNISIKATPLQQFVAFGHSLVDKIAVWNNQITRAHLNFPNRHELLHLLNTKKGFIIFTAHLGNVEILRAISSPYANCKINALIFNLHAQKFNQLLSELNPNSQLNLICVQNFDINLAIQLQQKIDQGEIIIIACDRTAVSQTQRIVNAQFLGKEAPFPQGGFLLAHLLQTPVYTMFCLKNGKKFEVAFKHFADNIKLSRDTRNADLKGYVQQYSDFLGEYCIQYPTQWFNFFDFWHKDNDE